MANTLVHVLQIVAPAFLIILLGYSCCRLIQNHNEALIKITMGILVPAFAWEHLYRMKLEGDVISEVLLSGKLVKTCQLIIYLSMGWACSLDFPSLKSALPHEGFLWLAAGGVTYTAGIVFYIVDKVGWLNHAHGIWHFFVLAGSTFHFIAVIGYLR